MNKLNFQIVQNSSADPDYPITELLLHDTQSRGWMSSRFCEYPQEITIEFFAPVRVRHIQFLSHEAKISSRLDLYTSIPDFTYAPPNNEIKFVKLGYLNFDSNERSQFKARELKSVYVDAPCLQMKIILNKNHPNKHNIFNQVGLILLNFYGEPFIGFLADPESRLEGRLENGLEYSTVFNPIIFEKIKELEIAKQKAIILEDYEEARVLKEEVDRIKTIGDHLRMLEERKLICIQNEDFASAKLIKSEIDQLKNYLNGTVGIGDGFEQSHFENNSLRMHEIKETEIEDLDTEKYLLVIEVLK